MVSPTCLRAKLLEQIEELLNTIVVEDKGSALQEQGKELVGLGIAALKARLRKEGLEVSELEARIADTYAEREKRLAEARKLNAEADSILFENNVRKLRLVLQAQRALLVGEEGEEALLFGQQLTYLLDCIDSLEQV